MEITRTTAGEHVEIRLKGRLDAIWCDHVGRTLAECVRSGQHDLAVDMAEVDYVSSAGLRILVVYAKQLKAIQGRLSVVNPSANVQTVLKLARLDTCLSLGEPAPATRPPDATASRPVAFSQLGTSGEVFDLDAEGSLRVAYHGDAETWLAGQAPAAQPAAVEFPVQTLGLGLGILGADHVSGGERWGEFLAAGGAAICQVADGTHKPDYLLLQGTLTPAVQVGYGLVAQGKFRRLLRFDKGPDATSVPLSTVVQTCLQTGDSDALGVVMVAETAALIGAALQKTPGSQTPQPARSIFTFPDVREWLSFTSEPAFTSSTTLIVGVVATGQQAASLRMLKPLDRSGEWYGHLHAAAFPYRPLRKGRVELAATITTLFDSEQVLGLLHLLNDWRPASGAGESRFLRGACWYAPLTAIPA